MAEAVQAILERMVAPLRDLRDRGIFSEEEIHAIVTRRRRSEYLLQKRTALKSDYLRYIEQEILLEKLRKLRKQKVAAERREKMRNGEFDAEGGDGRDGGRKRKHAYQTSGPGDSHVTSTIHFLYQRLLKKFHYPLDVILNYAEFAKENKSWNVMSRVYAEGLQRHPREEGLWIQAASFEFFGYVAQDDSKSETTKLVGSSVQNARVLLQRGLRINGSSKELWVQYFALELHYVVKLAGRREILEGSPAATGAADEEEEKSGEEEEGASREVGVSNTMLLPCQIIYKNAIKSIPGSVSFRLRFVETCRLFPKTNELERYIVRSIERDFGESVDAWVARITFAEEKMKKARGVEKDGGRGEGFLAVPSSDGEVEPVAKKRRLNVKDGALELVHRALEAVPTGKMYLECTRYLQLRIQRLAEYRSGGDENSEEEEPEDASHLLIEDEDVDMAIERHSKLLMGLYSKSKENGVQTTSLTLDQVDFLSSTNELVEADKLLGEAIASGNTNAQLFIRWASISQQMKEEGLDLSQTPVRILRKGLDATPIHSRDAYLLLSTELMKQLMTLPQSPKVTAELKSAFQKLLLTSQGVSMHGIPSNSHTDDNNDDQEELNLADTFLAYLDYTIPNDKCSIEDNETVRSIYQGVLFHSNYGKSCIGKSHNEISYMSSFFDTCLHFEKEVAVVSGGAKKEAKKWKKQRLIKLYEAAIAFFEGGRGDPVVRSVVDGYQRELDNVKFGL